MSNRLIFATTVVIGAMIGLLATVAIVLSTSTGSAQNGSQGYSDLFVITLAGSFGGACVVPLLLFFFKSTAWRLAKLMDLRNPFFVMSGITMTGHEFIRTQMHGQQISRKLGVLAVLCATFSFLLFSEFSALTMAILVSAAACIELAVFSLRPRCPFCNARLRKQSKQYFGETCACCEISFCKLVARQTRNAQARSSAKQAQRRDLFSVSVFRL